MPIDDILLLTPTTLAYGGDALGRHSDRAVFVPFALPGEKVRVRVVEEKKSFIRAELVDVLEPSPLRITPRCRHFGVCSGCHYQHLSYPDQLSAKEDILRDQLTRIGKIESPPVKPIVASPSQWNYCNNVQFHLSAEGQLGFTGITGKIIPISECHLPKPAINDFWPQLQFEPGTPVERIVIRRGENDDLLLALESESAAPPEVEIEADVSVVHLSGEDAVVISGDDYITLTVHDRRFKVSAGSFFQVNTPMAEKMVSHLLERLAPLPGSTFIDVYCGVGLFSAFFAPRAGRLIGVESSPSACEDFAVNLDEFNNVELYEAPAEDVLPHLNAKPGAILVDPPRTGLGRRVLDAIVVMNPRTMAYISYDPSTLARDAARLLAAGYRLVEVTPFDLFPQTYHIASITVFEKQ
jgi:23S rRNA (uracil1939-C5)-methyltransferase